MSECDPGSSGRWPSSSMCGAHGSCVLSPTWGGNLTLVLASSALDPSLAVYICSCDDRWSSSGDFISSPHQYCHVNQSALLPMWIVALLAVLVMSVRYLRVVQSYVRLTKTKIGRQLQANVTSNDASKATCAGRLSRWLSHLSWVWSNPTRRTLALILFVLICFLTLSIIKLVSVTSNLGGDVGADHPERDTNIGINIAMTFLYCAGSIGFLYGAHLSTILWATSALAFYPRAEGRQLMQQTQRELLIASVIHWTCYLLPIASAFVANYADESHPGRDYLDPYELLVALHFQFKGFVPYASLICDVRVGRKVIANLRAHTTTQEKMHSGGVVGGGGSVVHPAPNDDTRQNEMSVEMSRVPSKLDGPAGDRYRYQTYRSTARTSGLQNLVVPENTTSQSNEQQMVHWAPNLSPTSDPVSPLNVTPTPDMVDSGAATAARLRSPGPRGAEASSRGHSRSPSFDRQVARQHWRNTRRNTNGGATAIPGAVDTSSQPPRHTSHAAPSSPASPHAHRITQLRSSESSTTLTNASGANQRAPSPGPVIIHHTAEGSEAHLVLPGIVSVSNPLLQPRAGSAAPPTALNSGTTDSTVDPPGEPDQSPTWPSSPTTVSGESVVWIRQSAEPHSPTAVDTPSDITVLSAHLSTHAVTTIAPARSDLVGPAISKLRDSSAGEPSSPTNAAAAAATQAEMHAAHRAKLIDLTSRLSAHNRITTVMVNVWLVFNTLFAWIPLLRSFVPYVLPAQILFTVGPIGTFLNTLATNETNSRERTADEDERTTTDKSSRRASGGAPSRGTTDSIAPPSRIGRTTGGWMRGGASGTGTDSSNLRTRTRATSIEEPDETRNAPTVASPPLMPVMELSTSSLATLALGTTNTK